MKLEIYDTGHYEYLEVDNFAAAKVAMMSIGAKAHENLLTQGKVVKLEMKDDEYAIIGDHHHVWFSARIIN